MLYLDTSALLNLYVDEPGRGAVTPALAAENVVATQELAYIEAHAAFSRAERDPVVFACFDRRLNRAAEILGMTVVGA